MANVFDQFDGHSASNVFDKFSDTGTAAPQPLNSPQRTEPKSKPSFFESLWDSVPPFIGAITEVGKTIAGYGSPESNALQKQLGTEAREFMSGKVTPEAIEKAASVALSFNPANLGRIGVMELLRPTVNKPAAIAARNAGYVIRPQELTDKPGLLPKLLSGEGGKYKTWQEASSRNQDVTNELAAQAIGLPKDTRITPDLLKTVRQYAGTAYQDVANSIPEVYGSNWFFNKISALGGTSAQATQLFPEIVHNPEIDKLVTALTDRTRWPIPTDVALELVKKLRSDANGNMRARDQPVQLSLGMAQREAAEALDEMIERNVAVRTTNPGVVDEYRAARQLIAKTYDIEASLNRATGDVRANRLAALAEKGRPLTGELDTIAKTFMAFPKNMQNTAVMGGVEDYSILDMIVGVGGAMAGHPEALALPFARPLARRTVLSPRYQNQMLAPASAGPLLPGAVPGAASMLLGQQPQQ